MINTAALFSTAFLPGQAGFDTETITGLAEWRLDVPALFKLLIAYLSVFNRIVQNRGNNGVSI